MKSGFDPFLYLHASILKKLANTIVDYIFDWMTWIVVLLLFFGG